MKYIVVLFILILGLSGCSQRTYKLATNKAFAYSTKIKARKYPLPNHGKTYYRFPMRDPYQKTTIHPVQAKHKPLMGHYKFPKNKRLYYVYK